ncbi:MAG: VCBS repeat-containing protein, partial [Ginsengibacter sp.]
TKEMMENATVLSCHEARSGYFENDGKGKFTFHPFPMMAQLAPVNAIACGDINGDGFTDVIIAGNEYQANVMPGRYDASYGLLLTGDGKGNFNAVPPVKSGLILDGDVKDLKMITVDKKRILLAAINDAEMKSFAIKQTDRPR